MDTCPTVANMWTSVRLDQSACSSAGIIMISVLGTNWSCIEVTCFLSDDEPPTEVSPLPIDVWGLIGGCSASGASRRRNGEWRVQHSFVGHQLNALPSKIDYYTNNISLLQLRILCHDCFFEAIRLTFFLSSTNELLQEGKVFHVTSLFPVTGSILEIAFYCPTQKTYLPFVWNSSVAMLIENAALKFFDDASYMNMFTFFPLLILILRTSPH